MIIYQITILCIAHDHHRLAHVEPLDNIHSRGRYALGKAAYRHWPSVAIHPKFIKGRQLTIGMRIAQANFDFFFDVIRPKFTDDQAVGEQLNRLTDGRYIDTLHGRLRTINLNFPLHTGNRHGVF